LLEGIYDEGDYAASADGENFNTMSVITTDPSSTIYDIHTQLEPNKTSPVSPSAVDLAHNKNG
jgi:putative SOS response-associated peptidase YedK